MKKILFSIFVILVFSVVLTPLAMAASVPDNQTNGDEISRQQMEAQIYSFNEALAEFGASTPDQAVTLWVKGDQTRNGVYKYSVSCDQLKQWLVKRWGAPEKSFWIIGGSSPHLTNYEIINKTEISPTEIHYIIQYQWATSAGPENPSTEQLVIKNINNKWCVNCTVPIDGYQNY